ncbi:MAG: glycogen synthase GlgA [Acidobacteria bacterium]|nr:glycogen synthase GlgA [Acidobacteriota bacterium]
MKILMIASEAEPFAKTGGLADVVGALPRALARLGHAVDVVIPRYRGVTAGERAGRVVVPLDGSPRAADIFTVRDRGVRTVFVDHPGYYDREHLYGTGGEDYADNPARFTLLVRVALEWAASTGDRYDVVHAHDWQAGLAPVLLDRAFRGSPAFGRTATVLTIHNLAYQGLADRAWLGRLGLGAELMHVDALEYWGRISFLKGGIAFSRVITTVSPRYAQEIQTPEYGFGFDGILRHRAADLVGILNGIDYDQWDPARDPHLPVAYDAEHLEAKHALKRLVCETFGLEAPEPAGRPLVAMISRLVDQKGFDLVTQIADELPRLDASFVLLGTGEPRYEALWRGLAARHPGRIGARIGFDEALAHRIEGGADLFLMPSRFEPCGLNQMYSLRYGTVPVVRATGGLYDTVQNVDSATGRGTGFTFDAYSADALLAALRRALETYRNRPAWRRIQAAGMRQDFSWEASARQYAAAYERATIGTGDLPGGPGGPERERDGIR